MHTNISSNIKHIKQANQITVHKEGQECAYTLLFVL